MTEEEGAEQEGSGGTRRENVATLVLAYCRITDQALPTDARLTEIVDRVLADRRSGNADPGDPLAQLIEKVSVVVGS